MNEVNSGGSYKFGVIVVTKPFPIPQVFTHMWNSF